jgi:hypothetical protein
MFSSKQVAKLIKKLVEKSKEYEILSVNHVANYILNNPSKNLNEVTNSLNNNPLSGTKFVISAATARAGGEQAKYGEIIWETLDKCSDTLGNFKTLLRKKNAPRIVWSKFLALCHKYGKKPNEKLNKGLIMDFIKRAQMHSSNNLFVWLQENLKTNGVESTYLELLKIRGIGKKITSFILRDIVWYLDMEKEVPAGELIYLQPIDTWVRQICLKLWMDLHEKVDEFIIAKRIIDKCNELGVSSISFNQGAWYFGSQEVKDGKLLERHMRELLS